MDTNTNTNSNETLIAALMAAGYTAVQASALLSGAAKVKIVEKSAAEIRRENEKIENERLIGLVYGIESALGIAADFYRNDLNKFNFSFTDENGFQVTLKKAIKGEGESTPKTNAEANPWTAVELSQYEGKTWKEFGCEMKDTGRVWRNLEQFLRGGAAGKLEKLDGYKGWILLGETRIFSPATPENIETLKKEIRNGIHGETRRETLAAMEAPKIEAVIEPESGAVIA